MKKHRRLLLLIAAALLVLGGAGAFVLWQRLDPDPEAEADRLMAVLALEPGMSMAEIGAGSGQMSVALAKRLGPGSQVYSTEIDNGKLDRIRSAAAAAGLANVTVIEAAEAATNLPDECCDAILMRRVYHHITDPPAFNASVFRSLRPGGRLAVIDFAPGGWTLLLPKVAGVPGDRGGHGMPPDILTEEVEAAGFELERRIDDWYGYYCIVFRKR